MTQSHSDVTQSTDQFRSCDWTTELISSYHHLFLLQEFLTLLTWHLLKARCHHHHQSQEQGEQGEQRPSCPACRAPSRWGPGQHAGWVWWRNETSESLWPQDVPMMHLCSSLQRVLRLLLRQLLGSLFLSDSSSFSTSSLLFLPLLLLCGSDGVFLLCFSALQRLSFIFLLDSSSSSSAPPLPPPPVLSQSVDLILSLCRLSFMSLQRLSVSVLSPLPSFVFLYLKTFLPPPPPLPPPPFCLPRVLVQSVYIQYVFNVNKQDECWILFQSVSMEA